MMIADMEVNFLATGCGPCGIIVSLRNPSKEKVLKVFDELMEGGEGEDEFGMEAGFRWKRKNIEGEFLTGGYLQVECGTLSERHQLAEAYDDVRSNMEQTKLPPLIEKLRNAVSPKNKRSGP